MVKKNGHGAKKIVTVVKKMMKKWSRCQKNGRATAEKWLALQGNGFAHQFGSVGPAGQRKGEGPQWDPKGLPRDSTSQERELVDAASKSRDDHILDKGRYEMLAPIVDD